jgi:hypothetical protein
MANKRKQTLRHAVALKDEYCGDKKFNMIVRESTTAAAVAKVAAA